MRLVSVTPGVAEQLPLQRQGILGWEAHVAPSATLLSASQSNCSKRQRENTGWTGFLFTASQSYRSLLS